jgi:hypothetical protein
MKPTSKIPIESIKHRLKTMYPAYTFEIKHESVNDIYFLTAHKNGKGLSTLQVNSKVPMDEFWERIMIWMKPIVSYYHP